MVGCGFRVFVVLVLGDFPVHSVCLLGGELGIAVVAGCELLAVSVLCGVGII